jgi:chemotaxis protein CheD
LTSHQYFDRQHKRHIRRILPSEFSAEKLLSPGHESHPDMLMTVLGSCVAVCLVDIKRRIVGLNHFMLPSDDNKKTEVGSLNARYGSHAMELLINAMLKLGAHRNALQASVFGGARVLATGTDIGAANVAFGLEYLSAERINIVEKDVSGHSARKIFIDLYSGRIESMLMKGTAASVGMSEAQYAESLRLAVARRKASVSLFETEHSS